MKGIYIIANPVNSVYVGQSHNIKKRLAEHKRSIFKKSGINKSAIKSSFIKHGVDSHTFTFMHELPIDVEQCVLDIYEQFFIDQHKQAGVKILNLKDAGSKGLLSDEFKQKVSKGLTGKKQSLHTIEKRKKAISNIPETERQNQKRKMSEAARNFYISEAGEKHKQDLIRRLQKYNEKPRSEITLKRLSDSHKGISQSEETRLKRSEAVKLYWASLTPEQKMERVKRKNRKICL